MYKQKNSTNSKNLIYNLKKFFLYCCHNFNSRFLFFNSLRGILDFGIVKTIVNLGKSKKKTIGKDQKDEEEGKERETVVGKSVARSSYMNKEGDGEEHELVDKTDAIFIDENLKVTIEGRVKTGNVPR